MNEKMTLVVSSSPHIRADEGTRSIMLDVIIALMPALAVGTYMFGLRALAVTCVSVAACIFFEWGYRKLMKKTGAVGDLSAVVTGILLAFCLPPAVPYWIPVIGAFFAIVIVKQLYGGIGKNFVNPALAGRAFLASWPILITTWTSPLSYDSFFNLVATKAAAVDTATYATPMKALHNGLLPNVSVLQAFLGEVGGCIGEISALVLILGGIYLVIRKVITPIIPVAYIGTVAALTFLFPGDNDALTWMLYNLCCGGLMLGAIFMATDYSTSPCTLRGQLVFGLGCGLLTVFIRYFGSYPEGVSYAILIMNVTVWLIDKSTLPRRFGAKKAKKEAAKNA